MRANTLTALCALATTISGLPACGSPATPARGEVWGQVTSAEGEPLEGVAISIRELSTRSDDRGVFRLTEVPADATLDVIAQHTDYATGHVRIKLRPEARASVDLTLLPMVSRTIDADQGGVVTGEAGFSLALPARALADAAGNLVHGQVEVRYTLLDDPSEMLAAPGGMLAEIEGELRPLQSFGMVEVRFEREGEALSLERSSATFSFPASGEHRHGDALGLYHFDETVGVWKPRGSGTIVGDAFQATVDHFSWWNADEPLDETACVSGHVITPTGEDAANVLVHAVGLDLLTHVTALTDERGNFELQVPSNSRNALSAFWMQEVNGQTVAYRWSSPIEFGIPGGCQNLGDVRVTSRAATCVQGSVNGFPGSRRATWWVHDEEGLTSAFGFAQFTGGGEFCLDVPAGDTLEIGGDVTCDVTPVPLFGIPAACAGGGCQALPLICRTTGPDPDLCQCGTRLPSGECVYAEEVCDGADNDCDGRIDEGLTTLVTCGIGSCVSAGSEYCVGGVEAYECEPGTTDGPEDCNGRDDDCDGEIDEELDPRTGPACGIGACRATSDESCVDGGWQSSTCAPLPPSDREACNALDDDCNGRVDEDLVRSVSCGVGACNVQVSQACSIGNWRGDACPVPADFDACDVLDNDCDGAVDEDQCCGGPPAEIALTAQPGNPTILLLQDISASIQPSWTGVRDAVIAATAPLDQQIDFGLSVFPGRGTVGAPLGCAPGNVLVPPTRGAGAQITATLLGLVPASHAATPTAVSLDAARVYLSTLPGRRYVVLITDGVPTCNEPNSTGAGSSSYAAARLLAEGIPVYAIGWSGGGSLPDMQQLNRVARAGGTSTATEVSTPAALQAVLSDLANDTLICRFQLREPVQAGQLTVSLNGTQIEVLPESQVGARGWVLLDDGQTIELRGSACDERALGGVLRVDNSCGLCGEAPCDQGQCTAETVRDVRNDAATVAMCPAPNYRVSTGSWAGTYRNTKLASAPNGSSAVLGELIGGTASGIDDSGLGQPCFLEGLTAGGMSSYRVLMPPRICSIGGIAFGTAGQVFVAYNDLEADRAYFASYDGVDGALIFSREIEGFRRTFDLVAQRHDPQVAAFQVAVGAEARVAVAGAAGETVAPGQMALLTFAGGTTRVTGLPNFRTIHDLTVSDEQNAPVYVAGAALNSVAGYGRGIVSAIPYPRTAPSFTRTFPSEVRAIASRGQFLYIAGDLDRSSSFGCVRVLHAGGRDVYAARLRSTTGDVLWARQLGGPGSERLGAQGAGGGALALDNGDLVLVGRYSGSAQFAGASYGTGPGSAGAFVLRLRGSTGELTARAELFGGGDGNISPAPMSVDRGANGSLTTAYYGAIVQGAGFACAP